MPIQSCSFWLVKDLCPASSEHGQEHTSVYRRPQGSTLFDSKGITFLIRTSLCSAKGWTIHSSRTFPLSNFHFLPRNGLVSVDTLSPLHLEMSELMWTCCTNAAGRWIYWAWLGHMCANAPWIQWTYCTYATQTIWTFPSKKSQTEIREQYI